MPTAPSSIAWSRVRRGVYVDSLRGAIGAIEARAAALPAPRSTTCSAAASKGGRRARAAMAAVDVSGIAAAGAAL
jgi:hypothetical protein